MTNRYRANRNREIWWQTVDTRQEDTWDDDRRSKYISRLSYRHLEPERNSTDIGKDKY